MAEEAVVLAARAFRRQRNRLAMTVAAVAVAVGIPLVTWMMFTWRWNPVQARLPTLTYGGLAYGVFRGLFRWRRSSWLEQIAARHGVTVSDIEAILV